MSDIAELMQEYDSLGSGLCLSARADKTLPETEAQRVLELIDLIRDIYTKQDLVPRDHVWRLTYLFPTILSEAGHCRDEAKKKALENYAWNVEWRVSKIFEPTRAAEGASAHPNG